MKHVYSQMKSKNEFTLANLKILHTHTIIKSDEVMFDRIDD